MKLALLLIIIGSALCVGLVVGIVGSIWDRMIKRNEDTK